MARPFALSPPRVSEDDVEHACRKLLERRGYFVLRLQSGLFKTLDGRKVTIGEPGLPDYAVLHHRHPGFLIEVKRPGGRLSDQQEIRIAEIEAGYGVPSAVVDSSAALDNFLTTHETPNEQERPQYGTKRERQW